MIYALIGCLIIIGFLGFKLYQKQVIDTFELDRYKQEIEEIKTDINLAKADCDKYKVWTQQAHKEYVELLSDLDITKEKRDYEEHKLEECRKDIQIALNVYNDITDNKLKEIDASMEEQRQKRQEDLDAALKEKQQLYEKLLQDTIDRCTAQDEAVKEASETKWREAIDQITEYNNSIAAAKEKFESIERTLRTYDAEQQAKLFYTIQLQDEYKEDIEFLLTTVAAKVQHPDIISKLVWQEYVKPNLENTFKRIEIKAEPGIYKLTSLENGKCYVGKSTNVKNRITDHFKSVVGITSIADQAVHHAILKEGFWNWTIEIITYCDKDKLSELEKYYIEFFKAQEFGYNKNGGG